MTEITNENFEKMFPIIKHSIKSASFIAIDTELTGLVSDSSLNPSLFDSVEQRYGKQRISASNFIICQIGLALYSRDQNSNIFNAKTYTFYLCPRSLTKQYHSFAMDCSAVEFLCYNRFDFNKFASKGICYLNEIQEQNLRSNFNNYLETDFSNSSLHYEKSSLQISEWLELNDPISKSGTQLVLKCRPTVNPLANFVFLNALRNNCKSIWVQEIDNKFIVQRVNLSERIQLINKAENEEELVINKMVGFSRVFQCLVESRKPIVGHNMIMDLLLIYHHFYRPLPKKLKQFKSSLHSLFPYIFDTKCILFNERKNLPEISHILNLKSLGEIYNKLLDDEIANSYQYSPKIEQFTDESHSAFMDYSPHNAGFDAYATGFVFIKIGHILFMKIESDRNNVNISPNWFDFLKTVEKHCNKINLIRANIHYMSITEADPKSVRPQWLYAQSETKDIKLALSKLTSILSTHGTSDIKQIANNRVLIAVNSHGMARSILNAFQDDCDIKVTKYNVYKHNKSVRLLLWSTIAISSGFTSLLTINLIKSFQC